MNLQTYIERLEYELSRALEKNRKLNAEVDSLERKLLIHRTDQGDKIERQLKRLTEDNDKLRERNLKMQQMGRQYAKDRWYLAYLQSEMFNLERQYSNQQDIIEQYQKHFSKFGDFYSKYKAEHPELV